MTTKTVPVNVAPEAAAHIAELGLQGEFDKIMAAIFRIITDLHAVEVYRRPSHDPDRPEYFIWIDAYRDGPLRPQDPTDREWDLWWIDTIPPEVWDHFCVFPVHGGPRAR